MAATVVARRILEIVRATREPVPDALDVRTIPAPALATAPATLTVNAPANYIVWGTGTLGNAAAVLQPAVVQRFQASLTSDTTVHVAKREDVAAKRVTAQQQVNSWHFSARDIPDMAFGLSDHYDWDATSVVVDDATQRRAGAQAAFADTSKDYHHVAQYARHSLD